MSAFSNIPPQAVLPLGAYDLAELRRSAARADQRLLHADCSEAADKGGVMEALAKAFALPAHFGRNLDALYDCVTDLVPLPEADQPGFVVILQNLPAESEGGFDRDALLDVFRDAADFFFDKGTAFRVFYSVRKEAAPPARGARPA